MPRTGDNLDRRCSKGEQQRKIKPPRKGKFKMELALYNNLRKAGRTSGTAGKRLWDRTLVCEALLPYRASMAKAVSPKSEKPLIILRVCI